IVRIQSPAHRSRGISSKCSTNEYQQLSGIGRFFQVVQPKIDGIRRYSTRQIEHCCFQRICREALNDGSSGRVSVVIDEKKFVVSPRCCFQESQRRSLGFLRWSAKNEANAQWCTLDREEFDLLFLLVLGDHKIF